MYSYRTTKIETYTFSKLNVAMYFSLSQVKLNIKSTFCFKQLYLSEPMKLDEAII